MASSTPVKLSSSAKTKLGSIITDLEKLQWEKGEYYFHNFVDYYQLPQIIRVKQNWNTKLTENQWMYLQTLFDRYLIIASSLSKKSKSASEKYLIPDWFQGECRILSKTPRLKQRWWVFQGAFELYRFTLPRAIKVLSHTPAHRRSTDPSTPHEWEKVILNKNAHFSVMRREQYQSRVTNSQGELAISEPKEAFVIQNLTSKEEFLIPPGVPLRFATLIDGKELHLQYQNHDGTFTFPEIMMRYEFPIDIEILTHLPIDLPDFKSQIRLEKFCVAKSILAYLIDEKHTKSIELSPLTEFTLNCAKCLTFGLPQEGERNVEEKFDEKEYQRYEDLRSRLNLIFNETTEIQRSKIQPSTSEEIECIEAAYEISMKMRQDDDKPTEKIYLSLEEMLKSMKEPTKQDMAFPKKQPKRFTVHASSDPSNPYNEVIDYEDMDALKKYVNGKDNESQSETPSDATSAKRSVLVVQQLPPPMMLPPDSFEKTIKAIPEKLYTEFLPATTPKKSSKTDEKDKPANPPSELLKQ